MSIKERLANTEPIQYSTDEAISLILPILGSDTRILIAYLFGSRVNETKESSDIDILYTHLLIFYGKIITCFMES